MKKHWCSVYRSSRKNEMYLYVDRSEGLDRVPEALLQLFGTPVLVLELELTLQRKLAREDVASVLDNIKKQGFHLQMPPRPEDYLVQLPDELLHMNDPA